METKAIMKNQDIDPINGPFPLEEGEYFIDNEKYGYNPNIKVTNFEHESMKEIYKQIENGEIEKNCITLEEFQKDMDKFFKDNGINLRK